MTDDQDPDARLATWIMLGPFDMDQNAEDPPPSCVICQMGLISLVQADTIEDRDNQKTRFEDRPPELCP